MPGLAELLLATGLMLGSHDMNHRLEADRQDLPFSQRGIVGYLSDTSDNKKVSRFANAGFEGQEMLSGAMAGTKMEKPVLIASALNKLGYAIKPGSITGGTGDLKMLEKSKGKMARKVAQGALTVSAISDLLRAFGKVEGDSGFKFGQSNSGTPMLVFGGNF